MSKHWALNHKIITCLDIATVASGLVTMRAVFASQTRVFSPIAAVTFGIASTMVPAICVFWRREIEADQHHSYQKSITSKYL